MTGDQSPQFNALNTSPFDRVRTVFAVLASEALERAKAGETIEAIASDPVFIDREDELMALALSEEERETLAAQASDVDIGTLEETEEQRLARRLALIVGVAWAKEEIDKEMIRQGE